jgi:hypothetical protein
LLKPTLQIDNNHALLKDTSKYTCSILIGRNYLSYALSDQKCKIIYLLKHYAFEDKVIGKQDFSEILTDPIFKQVDQVKIAIDSLKSTLIPEVLFDNAHAEDYFKLIHDLPPEEVVQVQHVHGQIAALYSVKKLTVSFLNSIYTSVRFYDASSSLLNSYPGMLPSDDLHTCFLGVRDDSVTMSIYENKTKRLLLHQVYAEAEATDILYSITLFSNEFHLTANQINMLMHGESARIQSIQQQLLSYYPNVRFCSRTADLQFPEKLFEQPSHHFVNLFALVSCA